MPIRYLPHTRFARANRKRKILIANGAGQIFNGIDQYVYVTDNGALDINQADTDFCFGGLLKTGADISTSQNVGGKLVGGNVSGRYGYFINGGALTAYVESSGGTVIIPDNITLAINTEYHIMIRVDLIGSKVYFYIDNVLQNAGGSAFTGTFGTMINAYEFILAAQNAPGGGSIQGTYLAGQLRDVRIYHKDVTSDIDEWMLNRQIGEEVAWWNLPFLEGYGGTTYNLTQVNIGEILYNVNSKPMYDSLDSLLKTNT